MDSQNVDVVAPVAEIIPPPAQDPTTGRFVVGNVANPKGRPGTLNALTRAMKQEFAKFSEENGQRANPLVIMTQIMMEEENSPALRLQAARSLAQILLPKLISIETDPTDANFEQETLEITRTLRQYFVTRKES